MNYELYQDSDAIDEIFISSFECPAEFRPHVGDLFTLPTDLRVFKINRADPTNNPADQKVKYYAREHRDNSHSQFNIMVQTIPNNVPSL